MFDYDFPHHRYVLGRSQFVFRRGDEIDFSITPIVVAVK